MINGVTIPAGAYMKSAYIHDASVTNAKIANLAVDNAKIANLSANKLTAGAVAVGEYIQSSGYVSGSAGWRIHGDGSAEFANIYARGNIRATSFSAITINANEHIKQGQTAYNTGTGFFLGDNGAGVPVFSLGVAGSSGLTWNGSVLAIKGDITGSNGSFSGDISAATGNFGGVITGTLQGATGTFSGRLSAGVLDSSAFSGQTITYATPGYYTVVIPNLEWSSVSMRVTLVGAGGGAQSGWGNYGGGILTSTGDGAGGKSGASITSTFANVTPGASMTLTIGQGGLGGLQAGNTDWYPGGTSPDGQPGRDGYATTLSGYVSASGGQGGGKWQGRGMYFDFDSGDIGQASSLAAGGTASVSGNLGSGGGGGWSDKSNDTQGPGGNGGNGYAVIEFFDPNFVVTNVRYRELINWLDTLGHGSVPTAAR